MWTCPACKGNVEDHVETCWTCGAKRGETPATTQPIAPPVQAAPDATAAPPAALPMDRSSAFIKGGVGCLIAFLVFALFAVLLGGTAHVDFFGVLLLFVIGGLLGLLVRFIHNKGRQAALPQQPAPRFPDKET